MSDRSRPCGQLPPQGLTAGLQPRRSTLDPGFCLLSKNGAGFVSQNGMVCAAVGGTRKERREGRGGSRAPALPAPGQSQGGSISSLALIARPLGIPAWPPNRLFTEQGQRAQNISAASSAPSDPLSPGTGWPLGSITRHKRESLGKELQTPSPAHKPEVICRRLWALSADWGA